MIPNRVIFAVLLLLSPCSLISQLSSPAMVMQEAVKVSGKTTEADLVNLTPFEMQINRTYFDGLGRPIQSIWVQGSPTQKDIISFNRYNILGQELYSYLPFAGSNGNGSYRSAALTDQANFYNNGASDKVADDLKPWTLLELESSPLQRVLKLGGVGSGFQPIVGDHYKNGNQRSYSSVYTNDAIPVQKWLPDGTGNSAYSSNELSVEELSDEEGSLVLVYKNKGGQIVLKRKYINETIEGIAETFLDTYYVYDDVGQLRYIVPPKAVVLMRNSSGNYNVTLPAAAKFIYEFQYDTKGRPSQKKVPGQDWIYIVYHKNSNRPVLIQDANLRANSSLKWNYVKYDAKGREIVQGIYTHGSSLNQAAMQAYVDGLTYTYYDEERQSTDPYYTNNRVFPTTGTQALRYNFYDDYDLDNNGTANYSYSSQGLTGEATATDNVRGFQTMSRSWIVTSGTGSWLIEVQFYDRRGILIQTKQDNQLQINNANPGDHTTIVSDFIGQVKQVKQVKTVGATTTTALSTYMYDHAGRKTQAWLMVNAGSDVKIGDYSYNELGQLVDKKHFKPSNNSVLQSVDYRYNIRGQLLSINNSTLTNDGGTSNDETDDLFGMNFLYETSDASLGNTGLYNGLISGGKWKTALVSGESSYVERGYAFTYDKLMRLKSANYKDKTGGTWTNANTGIYDEKNITYDHMGNIKTLNRYFGNSTTPTDQLIYTYDGNQLTNVSDVNSSGAFNGTNTNPYTYDINGSLTSDPKKGLTITYNVLNKTQRITVSSGTGRYIEYSYLSTGTLLKKQVYDNNVLQKTIDYIDGFVYENSALKYFGMDEGRIRIDAGTAKYEYMITDHLGNVRISFEEIGGVAIITQRNNYYAFGLILPDAYTPTNPNKNLFNAGSELQNDFASNAPDYYQTFYRNYDAALGRFISIDIMAELYDDQTSYQYALNNPTNLNDPFGDLVLESNWFVQAVINLSLSKYGGSANKGEAIFYNGFTDPFFPDLWPDLNNDSWMNGLSGNMAPGDGGGSSMSGGGGGQSSLGTQNETRWKPFYKSDLKTYASIIGYCTTCSENDLGNLFEDIFYNWMTTTESEASKNHGFKRNSQTYYDSGLRNTKPDMTSNSAYAVRGFLGIPTGEYKFVEEGSWFELKQKLGGVYLSTSDGQIEGHLQNMHSRFLDHIKKKFTPVFNLVTTWDVPYSNAIVKKARDLRIFYVHAKSVYRIVNGKWEFKFIAWPWWPAF